MCPRLLRLRSRRAVQRPRGRPVAPVHHLPAPPPGPARRASPRKRLRALVRIRYVKVAEYQARGVVHFHAVIRLDAPGDGLPAARRPVHRRPAVRRHRARPPPPSASPSTRPRRPGRPRSASAAQTDARPIRRGRPARHRPAARRPGGGQLHRQVRHQDPRRPRPARPPASAHALDIERAALPGPLPAHDRHRVAARRRTPTGDPRLRQWAHMLGYGGHFLTKSRRYSVTFGQLRRARTEHRRAAAATPTANATPGAAPSTRPSSWSCRLDLRRNRLHPTTPIAELAAASAARAREHHGPGRRTGG